jgi:RNA polymerase sigma-70 factor, ECF subfamily
MMGPDNLEETMAPDEHLMARVAQGDTHAFEILVRRHETSVLNLIFRFLGNRSEAEDLAQEAFLRVWKAAKGYEPHAKFTTWMYRIVSNLCLNELKSPWRKRLVSFHWFGPGGQRSEDDGTETAIVDETPSPEDRLLAQERRRRVAQALQCLPKNQRLALILKRYEGLSYQEIAKVLGCSVSAVESLLVRGKKNLQDKLGPGER